MERKREGSESEASNRERFGERQVEVKERLGERGWGERYMGVGRDKGRPRTERGGVKRQVKRKALKSEGWRRERGGEDRLMGERQLGEVMRERGAERKR